MSALVFGSINVDEFFSVPHIVRPGETLSSTKIEKKAGGKGANQAVAIAKSEKNVTLAGQIGKDGEWLKNLLESFNVSTDLLEINDDIPTGRATIQISNEGENSILLFGGTNQLIYNRKLDLSNFTHLLLQEEIVHSQTCETLVNAKEHNVTSIYNPSPMPSVEDIIKFPWSSLDYIIVNAGEATDLFSALSDKPLPSKPSPLDLIDLLMNDTQLSALQGLIITLGEKGLVARIKNNENKYVTFDLPSTSVKAVDTTGAGDTFAGYFTSCLMSINDMSDQNIELSLKNSMGAAALAVTKPGAMEAIPDMKSVEAHLNFNEIECIL